MAAGSAMMAGLASARTTSLRPADTPHSKTALCGSCWSSWGSTTASLARCAVRASEPFAPTAREVLQPHDIQAVMPAVIERASDSAPERLVSALTEPVRAAIGPCPARPRLRLRPVVAVTASESPTESAEPSELLYVTPTVSATDAPTVSVSWLTTKRCRAPIWSAAAFASSALPSRMKATAAFPRPSRSPTWAGMLR